jgi:hypothetical protein
MYDELYAIVAETGVKLDFHEGLPAHSQLTEKNDGNFHIIVLDDLMEHIVDDKNAQALFTKYCHHYNMSCVFITQNIFAQGKCARTIALNTHVLVIFANRRDKTQVRTLARQQAPINPKAMIEAYEDATSKKYGYIIIDCSPGIDESDDMFRWRTNIFPDDSDPVICYISKDM